MASGFHTTRPLRATSLCAMTLTGIRWNGSRSESLSSMSITSTFTDFAESTPTNSSLAGTDAPSTETGASSSSPPMRSRRAAPRSFPLSKTCAACSRPFLCRNAREAYSKACGLECRQALRRSRPTKARPTCQTCGAPFTPKSNLSLAKAKHCSTKCSAAHRMTDPAAAERLRSIAATGKAGWTDQSRASYQVKMTGPGNPAWKGGVMLVSSKGNYQRGVYVRCPQEYRAMGRRDGWILQHRLMVAQVIGRMLTTAESVHHVNHDPRDNRLANLMLFANNSDHKRYERHGSPLPIWSV